VWNNIALRVPLCRIFALFPLLFLWALVPAAADEAAPSPQLLPKLLLNPQRLRRLQRDRERQTIRWANFESRVQSAPDSPERGFELALYFAVTHDEQRGREAIQWALAHLCDQRQVALILDWCRSLITDAESKQFTPSGCDRPATEFHKFRDAAFMRIAQKQDLMQPADILKQAFDKFRTGGFRNANELYALCEYLDAVRTTQRVDLRQDFGEFFSHLPVEFLLAMEPDELAHPSWQARAAALILVTLDPNLPDSQFLQGWAIEDQQMIRDGDGVAYEFLWGNPYLPGVSYQNLDPWFYDQQGRLFARSDWTPNACWIAISPKGVEDRNCPADWRQKPTTFGHLTLVPMTSQCVEPPRPLPNDAMILWAPRPGQRFTYREGNQEKPQFRDADASGLFSRPISSEGKFCAASR
jgi:hypothetical protein